MHVCIYDVLFTFVYFFVYFSVSIFVYFVFLSLAFVSAAEMCFGIVITSTITATRRRSAT